MFQFIKNLFSKPKGLGLLPLKEDDRDFELSLLGGWFGAYVPKHQELDLPLRKPKTQKFNTCSFNSGTAGKELDEGVELSVRFAVIIAKKLGLISGDGFADLRAVETVKQKYGICEASLLGEGPDGITWEEYSDYGVITQQMLDNAAKHKSASFWRVRTFNDALELLDAGKTVRIGIIWRRSFNMSGGFKFPWILDFSTGSLAGGHATLGKRYKLVYFGNEVIGFRNSYGDGYGEGGDGYITRADLEKMMDTYGAYADLDITKDLGKFLRDNNGKAVKIPNNANVWLIKDAKKWLFPNLATFIAWGFKDQDIVVDNEGIVAQIPDGAELSIWDGKYLQQVKQFAQVLNEVLNGKDEADKKAIIDGFKTPFEELFNN